MFKVSNLVIEQFGQFEMDLEILHDYKNMRDEYLNYHTVISELTKSKMKLKKYKHYELKDESLVEIKREIDKKMERLKFENKELKSENIEHEWRIKELEEMLDSLCL